MLPHLQLVPSAPLRPLLVVEGARENRLNPGQRCACFGGGGGSTSSSSATTTTTTSVLDSYNTTTSNYTKDAYNDANIILGKDNKAYTNSNNKILNKTKNKTQYELNKNSGNVDNSVKNITKNITRGDSAGVDSGDMNKLFKAVVGGKEDKLKPKIKGADTGLGFKLKKKQVILLVAVAVVLWFIFKRKR
jgi:hypothetical protein